MKLWSSESLSMAGIAAALVFAAGFALRAMQLGMHDPALLGSALVLSLITVASLWRTVRISRASAAQRNAGDARLASLQAELEAGIALRSSELERLNQQLGTEAARREATQRALAQSEQRLQQVLATMPVALVLKDAESRIVLMNQAAEEQIGLSFGRVRGTRASSWSAPDQVSHFERRDLSVFASRQMQAYEQTIWNPTSKESRLFQTLKKPVYDANGRPELLICIFVDITERKRAEQALEQSCQQMRQLTEHLETLKEDERRRIALDIHDDLGQNLMALKIDVEMMHASAGSGYPHLQHQIGRALDTIDTTLHSVRAIINELHPSTLELGLAAALEWLVVQFEQRSGIAATLSASGGEADELDSARTSAIFRIVQEALLNILRHAEATQVEMALRVDADDVHITILDDGIDIAHSASGEPAAAGLRELGERIAAFAGELKVGQRRGRGNGTVLSIVIPARARSRQLASIG